MEFSERKLISEYDGLELSVKYVIPEGKVKGIVQISHGMTEHKERYEDFMSFLASNGYAAVTHDHRGHGASVNDGSDLGYFYTDDISAIRDDLHQVTLFIKGLFPDAPLWLFGHSMGSLVARCYLKKYDAELSGLILCGPPTRNPAAPLALLLARLSSLILGPDHRSRLIDHLAFSLFNKGYDVRNSWLSSDEENVRHYNEDPLCGFLCSSQFYADLIEGSFTANSRKLASRIRKDIPMLIVSGDQDPVGGYGRGVEKVYRMYRKAGLENVSMQLFSNDRHELLNETDRDDVMRTISAFMQSVVKEGNAG